MTRRRRVELLVLAVLLVTVLVAGAGVLVREGAWAGAGAEGDAATAGGDQSLRSSVQATLDLMTDGVRRRDEARFLSAVDPRQTAVVARQRAVFRALTQLPLQAPEYVWPDYAAERVEANGSVTVAVDFRYQFRGWDTVRALDPVTFTFTEVDGGWRISDDPAEIKDLVYDRFLEPWMTGVALAVEQREHVLVIGDGDHRAELARLATRFEKVVGEVRRVWPEPSWNGKVVAYASADRRFLDQWFEDDTAARVGDPEEKVTHLALQGNLPGEEDWSSGPSRIAVSPYLLQQGEAEALPTLQHEVTHAAVSRTGRSVPFWMTEGAAEYTSYLTGEEEPDVARMLRRHTWSEGLDKLEDDTWEPDLVHDSATLKSVTGYERDNAYFDGWIASLYIAQEYGEPVLRRLYHVAAAQPESATMEEVEAAALDEVLGIDHDTLTEAVRDYGIGLL